MTDMQVVGFLLAELHDGARRLNETIEAIVNELCPGRDLVAESEMEMEAA